MATNFVSFRTSSLRAKVSQYPLDRFLQSLYLLVDVELQMIIQPSFSDILRDVAMATNLVAKMGQNYLPPTLIATTFRNGMGCRHFNVRVNSANASILCDNFVKFGAVTPELTGLICERQVRHGLKTNWRI